MDAAVKTGAEGIVRGLAAAGVECVFGLPGDTGVELYDAFGSVRGAPRHVMCRDERHAVAMADVYARCTNRVGVVEVSSGGGASFSIGGLGEPFAASVPLLVISSDIHAGSRGSAALTELDQQQLFAAVTKWCRRVESAADLPGALAEGLRVAASGRPAPVALIVPENVLGDKTEPGPGAGTPVTVPCERPEPDRRAVEEAAGVLAAARRPAIVAGGGVHTSGAYAELAALAEGAGVPVGTTIHGKGAYDETAALSLGVAGANGARPYANSYLASADAVLFVGTRANATDTDSYRSPPRSASVVQIDIDEQRAGRNYPGSTGIVADARAALAALAAAVGPGAGGGDARRAWIDAQRRAWRAGVAPGAPVGTVHPVEVLAALREVFGPDALIVADCGTPTPFLACHWEVSTPGRSLVVARGHGPMGYAIPGGVAAAVAHPHRRVVVLTTDGSLAMACGELETVARLGLAITFVQLTNGSYGWIKMLQHLYHDRRYFGVDLGPVDAVAVAAGFGVPGRRVGTAAALRAALAASAGAAGPAYIDVSVPDLISAPPPVAPWTAALEGSDRTRPVY